MKIIQTSGMLILMLFLTFSAKAQEAYKDTNLPVDERVDDLISRMTVSEKIGQLGHKSSALSKFGIKSYNYWNEALHGVARAGLATSFPQAIAMSSTWNPELIFEVATAISDEARVKSRKEGKGLTYWSPTINMARDPRWGRSEENYGEDPYLAAQIAINFIKGMQGNDPHYLKTVATAKHFAANNIEVNRTGISSDVDERSLREYYLPAFEATVKEGGVYSLMSAYNAVNGVPSPVHRTLLQNILRNEWGFDGYVVSDCDATENVFDPHSYVASLEEATAFSLINGTDLNCGGTVQDYAQKAMDAGLMTEKDIDVSLKRILKARFLLGDFDPSSMVPYHSIPDSLLDSHKHRELALQTSRESIVLLKNEAAFLPLQLDKIDTIAVIGPNANAVQLGGYSGTPKVSISALQGIANKMGLDIANGMYEAENFASSSSGIQTEPSDEGGSNIGYITNGSYVVYDVDFGSGKTKIDIRVAGENSGTIEVLLGGRNGTSIGSVEVNATGGWQNWTTISLDIAETSGAQELCLKFKGASGYLFNVNWFQVYNEGDEDPLGGGGRISYAKGCDISGPLVQAEIDKAVALAKKADVAVLVCGTDLSVADEYVDRVSLDLPGAQNALIEAVFAANPNTVLVLVNGFSLAINWPQENMPAILSSWYNGQSQGTALADVLFGDYNPAGRLTTTWFKSLSDLPDMNDYDIKNNRTYMYFDGTPLYAFGHGLSYADFTYSNLSIPNSNLSTGDSIAVSVDVTNSGEVSGDEVVQLYAHVQSTIIRPNQELKGFKRIRLEPAETKTVTFYVKHADLRYYDEASKTYKVENGNVDISVGGASDDIRLQAQILTTEAVVAETYRQNPFTVFQAEYLEGKSKNAGFSTVSDGNLSINMNGATSHIVVKNFDFTIQESSRFSAVLASAETGNTIDIVLDNLDGTVVGTLAIDATSSANTYTFQTCDISNISGVRDVYLVFRGAASSSCQLDWFSFSETVTSNKNLLETSEGNGFSFNVYPNPAKDNFTMHYNLPEQSDVSIDIFSSQGSKVKSYSVKSVSGKHSLNISNTEENFSPGLYVVNFKANEFRKSLLVNIIN